MIKFFRSTRTTLSSELGRQGEQIVAEEYKRRGYQLIARNYYHEKGLRRGEIDVIVKRGNELVFVEVKSRSSQAFGGAPYAVPEPKKRKLLTAAKQFIADNKQYELFNCRIDVALVTTLDNGRASVTILENAVEDQSSIQDGK